MFANQNSSVSVTIAEVSFNDDPFDKTVHETHSGKSKTWRNEEPLSGMRLIFYAGH